MLTAIGMTNNRMRIHTISTNRNAEIKMLVHNKKMAHIFVGKEIVLFF